jgi:hypothetical protein
LFFNTSVTTTASGQNPVITQYKAWGEVRYASGTSPTKSILRQAQDSAFTGQYSCTYGLKIVGCHDKNI